MKLLYGSQNFGYNTQESDRDWLEFIYPSLEDIVNNKMTCKEVKNADGSSTKVRDIRLLINMLNKANFSDLQVLYSQEMYDCEDLAWFIENRDRLVRSNIEQSFNSNRGCVLTCLKEGSQKSMVRAFAFVNMLGRVLNVNEEFVMREPELSTLRNKADLTTYKTYLEEKLEEYRVIIETNSFVKDEEILQQAKDEVTRLLKVHLSKLV